ncbi:MAG: DEAD/DEAH box helicase [Nitrosomonas sp.]|nr:DEAD/DEAH box helicase [Nitrosomonas sp.]
MNGERLIEFEKLAKEEQDILIVLSVIYIPIRQGYFQDLLKKSECVPASVANSIGKPLREKLQSLGLITLTKIGWWYCPYDIADTLLLKGIDRSEWIDCLERLVRTHTPFMQEEFNYQKNIRLLRIYFFQKKEKEFLQELERIRKTNSSHLIQFFMQFFGSNFNPQWFETLPEKIKLQLLLDYLNARFLYVENNKALFQLLKKIFCACKQPDDLDSCCYVELNLLRGDLEGIEDLLKNTDSALAEALLGALYFIQDRNDASIERFQATLVRFRKETGKRNVSIGGYPEYLFYLALFRSQTKEHLDLLRKQLQSAIKHQTTGSGFTGLTIRLLYVLDIYQSRKQFDHPDNNILLKIETDNPYNLLFQVLMLYWLDKASDLENQHARVIKKLKVYCQLAEQNDYFWFAAVSSNLLDRLGATDSITAEIARKYKDSTFNAIIDLIPRVEHWKRALNALTLLGEQKVCGTEPSSLQKQVRMAWLIELDEEGNARLFPKMQRLDKNGKWSMGRPVAVKRLREEIEDFDYLTEQDRRICDRIEIDYEDDYYNYYRREIFVLRERAVVEAAGHPNVYWSAAGKLDSPIHISMAELQLVVLEQNNSLLIKIVPYPQLNRHQHYVFERTASNDLLAYKIDQQHHDVASILGEKGLKVPKQARQQVIDSISGIASMLTIQSEIGARSAHAETVEADSCLQILLQPMGDGIQVEILVQPFANGGPVYKPGKGGATVLAEIDGIRFQTTRDLELEQKFLDQVMDSCPDLYDTASTKWLLDDAEMALETLLQLQNLGDFAVLKWPQGKSIKISRETGLSHVHFSVRKTNDWFSLSGDIQVDENHVIEIQNLMALLSASKGRFVKLDDGQFITLTNELRQRLDDLAGLGRKSGKDLAFHALASWTLNDLTGGMHINASKQWREQLKKLSEIDDLHPQLPSTFQGELRDYQLQGYQWLTRLAYLGAGACLADDMGLGKTIQSLALILSRAADGPTLILAPTSVCNNWLEEAQRFAPTLNVYYFGSGDRQKRLDEAGPFDLIVCSYGLLQTEAERLGQKCWHTIVADEAQAIKNPSTQRSKAAMALKGGFKMITTGTPIENHLGELWNVFHFINPGLLGSLNEFNARYALDIENKRDHSVQRRLKRLLQPFILRRLKRDVLTELPARTEVTLHIELSEEERDFYEALRRNALQSIEVLQKQSVPGGQQHLQVLAEITRLRRACCNPRLISPEIDFSSAKLQAFEELVDELIANQHKALVFSQFVAHLAIIRELLDKKGIQYQYLDGATSVSNRRKAVNAFQSGQGDLFLISLKAGGAGLNLTAADYVVHMDPWWNPAVEDQASDRAHRMGQKRPVTVYRLIVKDTIEDKIVALHKHKRDLADSLLADGDISGRMSIKDMLELLGAREA